MDDDGHSEAAAPAEQGLSPGEWIGVLVALLALAGLGLFVLNWWVGHSEGRHAPAASPFVHLAGDPSRGRDVFVSRGCGDCHRVASLPQARGTLGPALDGLATRAGSRRPGVAAEDYMRESIEDPPAFVVRGYLNAMPALRGVMSDQDLDDLIAWLMTLQAAPVQGSPSVSPN